MEEQESFQQRFYTPTNSNSSNIDIRYLLSILMSKWYLFAISAFVFLAIGLFFLNTLPQIYESKASILVRVQHSAPEEHFLLKGMGANPTDKSNRDNDIGTIKSLDLVTSVITKLELNTSYRRKNNLGLYTPELYKQSPLYIRMEEVSPENIPSKVEFVFKPSQTGFNVDATYFLDDQKRTKQLTVDVLPGFIELEIGMFYVARQDVEFGVDPLKVTISNSLELAHNYISNLEVDNNVRRSSLLYVVLKTENR